jgi:hypothetical protein
MTNPGPTKEDYDTLISKIATLESELDQARMLLEAPAKGLWVEAVLGLGAKAAVVPLVVVLMVRRLYELPYA